jgi:hypothetical protein
MMAIAVSSLLEQFSIYDYLQMLNRASTWVKLARFILPCCRGLGHQVHSKVFKLNDQIACAGIWES